MLIEKRNDFTNLFQSPLVILSLDFKFAEKAEYVCCTRILVLKIAT